MSLNNSIDFPRMLFLKSLTGFTKCVYYNPEVSTVRDLENVVAGELGEGNIIVCGRLADPNALIESYEPQKLATIHYIQRKYDHQREKIIDGIEAIKVIYL